MVRLPVTPQGHINGPPCLAFNLRQIGHLASRARVRRFGADMRIVRASWGDAIRSGVLVALTATATFSIDVPASLAAPTVNSRPAAKGRPMREPAPIVQARRFDADYSDILHPLCERHVRVDTSQATGDGGWVAHFYGTDVGPPGIGQKVSISCAEDNIKRYTLRDWEFDAKISSDGQRIDAGDGVHVGQWREQTPSRDGTTWSGIRWSDGNKWVVTIPDPNETPVAGRPADMPAEIAEFPPVAVPMSRHVLPGDATVDI